MNAKKFVRYQEGAEKYSLGLTKFQELAKEAKAVYKIDKVALVNCEIFERYLKPSALHKNRPEENPRLQTAHSVALQSSSWEKSPLFYAKSELFFPVIPEAVIIHSHKRIFFRQSNDGFLHFRKVLSRQKPSHDEEEPEEMGIIHCAIFPADQQRLFFPVKEGFCSKRRL